MNIRETKGLINYQKKKKSRGSNGHSADPTLSAGVLENARLLSCKHGPPVLSGSDGC